jgi:hypothetical protein
MEEAKGFQKKFDLKTTRNALAVGNLWMLSPAWGRRGKTVRYLLQLNREGKQKGTNPRTNAQYSQSSTTVLTWAN